MKSIVKQLRLRTFVCIIVFQLILFVCTAYGAVLKSYHPGPGGGVTKNMMNKWRLSWAKLSRVGVKPGVGQNGLL